MERAEHGGWRVYLGAGTFANYAMLSRDFERRSTARKFRSSVAESLHAIVSDFYTGDIEPLAIKGRYIGSTHSPDSFAIPIPTWRVIFGVLGCYAWWSTCRARWEVSAEQDALSKAICAVIAKERGIETALRLADEARRAMSRSLQAQIIEARNEDNQQAEDEDEDT